MSSTLPLLIASLLVANPQTPAPRSRGPNNAERAKMGLLPRRAAPSKVTYLTEAARSRADRRAFPEAGAPPVIVEASTALDPVALPAPEEAPAVAVAPVAPADPAPLAMERDPEPVAPAVTPAVAPVEPDPLAMEHGEPEHAPGEPEPVQAADRPAATESGAMADAPVTPAQLEEPTPIAQTQPAPTRAAPSKVARGASARVAPAAVVAPAAAAPAVRAGPEQATATVALVTQRFVDRDGRIVVRVLGPKARILSEQFDGDVRDLPVQWAGRTEQGEIIEIVEDDWGPIEVRRDPVGRFLSARTVDDPDWQE